MFFKFYIRLFQQVACELLLALQLPASSCVQPSVLNKYIFFIKIERCIFKSKMCVFSELIRCCLKINDNISKIFLKLILDWNHVALETYYYYYYLSVTSIAAMAIIYYLCKGISKPFLHYCWQPPPTPDALRWPFLVMLHRAATNAILSDVVTITALTTLSNSASFSLNISSSCYRKGWSPLLHERCSSEVWVA